MSQKATPDSPNSSTSEGEPEDGGSYPPSRGEKPTESIPLSHQNQGACLGPPSGPMPHHGPQLGAQPLPGIQHGFQPGMQPGFQPGMQPAGPPLPPGYSQLGYPAPIVQQPGGSMNIPRGLSNCPPGLEYLSMIDQLLVYQKIELLEAFTGFETLNKYTVMNSIGQKVYNVVEVNDCCTTSCCGSARCFDMKILDNFQKEVIHLNRPLACDSCCCPCCLQSMEVTAPPGRLIGSIEQEWSICKPCFLIKNAAGDVMLRIKGPVCTFSMGRDVNFHVYSGDGVTKVGKIKKQWSGFAQEFFTDADNFGITFPMDLDVRTKAVLLGACFLIDFMFFEDSGNNRRSNC